MKNPTINNRSLARRVALLAVAMLSGVLVTISVVMSLVAEERSRERIVQWVGDKTQSVADSVDAFDATARLMTDRAYRPFRAKFSQFFELDEAAGLIKSWSFRLNGETSDVDDFNKMTGGVATVFMRKGEDFERVTPRSRRKTASGPSAPCWRATTRPTRWCCRARTTPAVPCCSASPT